MQQIAVPLAQLPVPSTLRILECVLLFGPLVHPMVPVLLK